MSPSVFDRVVIADATGARRSYSVEQFLELPLGTRIEHILARDLEFFQGATRVERAEALKSLRSSSLASPRAPR